VIIKKLRRVAQKKKITTVHVVIGKIKSEKCVNI